MKANLVPVRRLASGEVLQLPVYRFAGRAGGPTAYLQASLHGSEVQGNWVIAELLERLPGLEILGDITLVPCANPFAQNHKMGDYTIGRFDPTDGENWNRAFLDLTALAEQVTPDWPSAKGKLRELADGKFAETLKGEISFSRSLALHLQRMAFAHDYMLDLHCAVQCESHAYVPAYCFDSFHDLPCRHALRIGPEFAGAMDEAFFAPWWRLGQRIEQATGTFPPLPQGFTLELGHQDWSDSHLAALQAEGILHFLARRGVVSGSFRRMEFPARFACDLKNYRTRFAPTGGFLQRKARLGEIQEIGDSYCEFLHFKDTFRREPVASPVRQVPITFTNAGSVHEGAELGKCMTEFFQVTP